MSTTPLRAVSPDAAKSRARGDIRIYTHSPLLYWWPVWAVGLLMALWTYLGDYHMVLVPQGTRVQDNVLTAPVGEQLAVPRVHVARSPIPGAVFVLTLLLVVLFSNASLRGPWALFTAATLTALVLLLAWLDLWASLFRWVSLLRIHLNLGAYLAISLPLLLMWFLAVFVFDRRTYMVFSAGQIRIRDELGVGEKVFDAWNASFEKKQYDWFRRLAGWGAGDLVVRAGGVSREVFELPNVPRVGKWLKEIERRLKTRDVE